jgi:transcriptional regulator with XRE-family HTH domain
MSDQRAAGTIDKRLGDLVRKRRLELGMSQERLAELLGVTFQQVQKYEKGLNRIAASRLHHIAQALDMPVAQFFDGILPSAKRSGAAHAASSGGSDSETAELLKLFTSARSAKLRRRILETVRSMVEEAASR